MAAYLQCFRAIDAAANAASLDVLSGKCNEKLDAPKTTPISIKPAAVCIHKQTAGSGSIERK